MLVCNVSLRPRRSAIAADVAEITAAVDALATGNVVFATLVDDPASVNETVDAYLGEIMLEAASASDNVASGLDYTVTLAEPMTATSAEDGVTIPAGFIGTTFDAASVSNVNLTNGDLTATHANTTSNSGARSVALKSAGKFYFEVTQDDSFSVHGAGDTINIMASATTYTNVVGNTAANYVTIYRTTGNIFASTTNSGKTLGSTGAGLGIVFGVAVDLTAKKIWFRKAGGNWNGLAIGSENPATGTGGVTIPGAVTYAPAVTFGGGSTAANHVFTANFGASSFSGTVPSGFTAGWPA